MDSTQFPVNPLLPSLSDGTFHGQNGVGLTGHPTFLTSLEGYPNGDCSEAALGSPFPQYTHGYRSTTPDIPLHSPNFSKSFLPAEIGSYLDLHNSASASAGAGQGRRRGISHPRPILHSPNPILQPRAPMVSEDLAVAGLGSVRAITPAARAKTPTSGNLSSNNNVGVVTPGTIPNHLQPNLAPGLNMGTPIQFGADSPRETAGTPRNDESEVTLKRLAAAASSLPLAELALKVKMVETGHLALRTDPFLQALAHPGKNDRAAHVFGIAWLQRATEPCPTAVLPRTRFYARYTEACADFNLNPVAPATFGRLVHILHPALKTRRLGGRGKSKYHYCGLGLVGTGTSGLSLIDPLQARTPPFSASPGLSPTVLSPAVVTGAGVTPRITPRMISENTSSRASTPVQSVDITPTGTRTVDCSGYSIGNMAESLKGPSNLKYVPTLFSSIDTVDALAPLALPSIYAYLNKEGDVDCDIADTVHLLYRVHCALVFELIRYLKVDRLTSLFEALPVIMTAPVLKLFTTDQVGNWVRDCDLVTYKAVIKMLARLQLQRVSPEIMVPLKVLSNEFINQMSSALHYKLPRSFVDMKLKAAHRFIALVKCLVRCIETGTAASGILSNGADKNAMLHDWLQLDMNDLVLREFPCALENSACLSEILEKSLLNLFDSSSSELPLSQFASFLFDLPSRFPSTSPWLFSLLLSNFLTTCLREMSLAGANSFGRWWIVRCWVDEYFTWCFQLGGFLYDELNIVSTTSVGVDSVVEKESSFIDLMEGIYEPKMETNWS